MPIKSAKWKSLSILLLLSASCIFGIKAEEIKMADGEDIPFLAIKKNEPDGLLVLTDSGVRKIRFSKMSDESQRQYGYNREKELTFIAQKIQAEANRYKQLADTLAKRTNTQSS